MEQEFNTSQMGYLSGVKAMREIVIHIHAAEYNPMECIETHILKGRK